MTTESLIFQQQLKLEEFELLVSPRYASSQPDHRQMLRAILVDQLAAKGAIAPMADELDAITNLDVRPRVNGWALSISHCPSQGGVALARGSFGLGFDVEETSRVSAAAAARVASFSTEKPIVGHASPVAFWVAKESSIKAFSNLARIDLNYGVVEITSLLPGGAFTSRWNSHEAIGHLIDQGDVTLGLARTL